MNYYGSICLTDIPKDRIQVGKNGKKYLNIAVNERREPGKYGDTHNVIALTPKERYKREDEKVYIGNLRPSRIQQDAQKQEEDNRMGDLPF